MAVVYEGDLARQLRAARGELKAAIATRTEKEAAYRSTSDGMAEAMRNVELTSSRTDRRRLLALQVAAEEVAYAEYRERAGRWGQRAGDGPLSALPCGANPKLTRVLVARRIMGTKRTHPTTNDTKVTLLRVHDHAGNERTRTSFTVPAVIAVGSLDDALAELRTLHPGRFDRFFADIATDIIEAM